MGKKKGNKENTSKNETPIVETLTETPIEINPVPDDPVSQIKNSLAILTKHVEAMGVILGVPKVASPKKNEKKKEQDVPKASATNGPASLSTDINPHARPNMTQEEKKAQRAAKAAEKKARAESAIAKKAVEANGELNNANKPSSSTINGYIPQAQINKQDNRAKQRAQAEAAIARKSSIEDETPTTSGVQQENGFSDEEVDGEKREKAPDPSTIPNYNKVPKKSSLKKGKHVSEPCDDDRRVEFDFQADFVIDSEDEMPYVHKNWPIPAEEENQNIHPAFKDLYTQCDNEIITELDDLCIEFIKSFQVYFADFLEKRAADETLSKLPLGADLKKALTTQISYLTHNERWPLPPPLGTIVSLMKREMNKMKEDKDSEILTNFLNMISKDYFEVAYKLMSSYLRDKIKKVDRIVLFNTNRVMEKVLLHCKDLKLTVCVIDNEANGRGYKLAKILMENNFLVEYTDLENSSSSIRPHCIAIFGSTAILSNGSIVSEMGTSQLCVLCQLFNVPTIFLSQTFKFLDKVTIRKRMALLHRESDEIVTNDLVTALVTELRIVPSTSAPAILRAKSLYNLET